MKKFVLTSLFLFFGVCVNAQYTIHAIAGKVKMDDEKWAKEWTTLDNDVNIKVNYSSPNYTITLLIDGNEQEKFEYLEYDDEYTQKLRKNWKNEDMRAYRNNNEAVFVQGPDLLDLITGKASWNPNYHKVYLIVAEDDIWYLFK